MVRSVTSSVFTNVQLNVVYHFRAVASGPDHFLKVEFLPIND